MFYLTADRKVFEKALLEGVKSFKEDEKIDLDTLMEAASAFTGDGMVYKKRLLNSVKPLKGKKVSVKNLNTLVKNMGIQLEKEDFQDLLNHLPIDENKMVDLNVVMDDAKAFTGEKVNVNNLSNVMRKMGLVLTDEEKQQLLKTLPIHADGKVYNNRLLKGVKALNGPRVKLRKVKSVMENMGIKLKDEELEELMTQLSTDDDRTVGLNDLMDTVSCIKGNGKVRVDSIMEDLKKFKCEWKFMIHFIKMDNLVL